MANVQVRWRVVDLAGPLCSCCRSVPEFAANHCPQCRSLKTITLSETTDSELISFCCDCGLTYDLRVAFNRHEQTVEG